MLSQNQLITLTLSGIRSIDDEELAEDYSSYFTTAMVPLYATANDVRRRIGAHIRDVLDDTINQLNFYHSQMAEAVASCETTESSWRYFANRWVTVMTSLVLLDNGAAFVGSTNGAVTKILGDFELTKGGGGQGSTKFMDLVDRLECELFKFDPAVRWCSEPLTSCAAMDDPKYAAAQYKPLVSQTFVRGRCEPNYPEIGRRWAYRDMPIATDYVKSFSRWYKTRFGF